MRISKLALVGLGLGLCGCNGYVKAVVNQPSDITLKDALQDAMDAINSIRSEAAQNGSPTAIGYNPCTLEATFSVTASGTANKSLVLNVAAPAGAPITIGAAGTIGETAAATRGNVVSVLFTTPACNPANTLGTTRPDEVSLLQQQIGSARQNIYMKPSGPPIAAPEKK